MADLLDLAKARKELASKDLLAIERDTALTWGGRAAASYAFVLEETDHAEQMRCFWEAETYRGEAVEHAAMTEDAAFLQQLLNEVEGHRAKAREVLLAAGHEFLSGNRTPKGHHGARPMTSRSAPEAPPNRAQRLASRGQATFAPAAPASEWLEVPESETDAEPDAGLQPGQNRSAQRTPGLGRRPPSAPTTRL